MEGSCAPEAPCEDPGNKKLLGLLLLGGAAGGIAAGIALSASDDQDQPVIPVLASP
jgi:hypothetical protein